MIGAWWSKPPCARNRSTRRLEIERLESRLVPSGSSNFSPLTFSAGPIAQEPPDLNEMVVLGSPAPAGSTTSGGLALSAASIPPLNSLPGARCSIYLNFLGDFTTQWGGFSNISTPAYDIDGDPTTFSPIEISNITKIWAYVAEDYAPFNINVTTVQPANLGHGYTQKINIGGSGSWLGTLAGGISFIGSFAGTAPNLSFVFPGNLANGDPKDVGDATAHEAGHAFGLVHQSLWQNGAMTAEYYTGSANGAAPIMGNSYNAPLSRWWYGTTDISPTTMQDDMATLAGATNGFGYRTDDVGNSIATASVLTVSGTSVTAGGVITTPTDVDYWSFTTSAGQITLSMNVAAGVNDLVAKLVLVDARGNVIATGDANSKTAYGATITATVAAGTYCVIAESHGGYGDVGQYTISGTLAQPSITAIDCGGGAAGSFVADSNYSGGRAYSTTHAIDTTAVTTPAPQAVYQSERYGNFSYTVPNLTPGQSYTVRFHFAEIYWNQAGMRLLSIKLNGAYVLQNFDIFAAAGAAYKAVVREFTATADASGFITIQFYGLKDSATVSGIEILASPATATARAAVASTTTSSVSTSSSLAQQLTRIAQFFSGDPSYNQWITWANNIAHAANASQPSLSQQCGKFQTQQGQEVLFGRHSSSEVHDWAEEFLFQVQL